MAQSIELGEVREVTLPQGTIRYRERGRGAPLVFVHGLLVNGDLWRKVVPLLAREYRCITPDLPLGAHTLPMRPDADLSVPGVARLITDFLAALGLEDATVIANDTGGALTQIALAERPERFGRVVLTSCDAYDNFLPLLFRPLALLARTPRLLAALLQPLRLHPLRRLPLAFGWLAKRPIERAIADGYVLPFLTDPDIRRDCCAVLRDVSPRHTLHAAEHFARFDRPVLIAWAAEDRFFPTAHAERLGAAFPDARVTFIEDSYTFVSEDQPGRLAAAIGDFLAETADRRREREAR